MITTPSSSALTTTYRPLASSPSLTVPTTPSVTIPVGLCLGPHRLEPRRRLAHQVVDLGDERRTGEHMITIGIHDHLAAADHHVQHHLVGAWVPRQHRLEPLR